jgi:hypothetical protein
MRALPLADRCREDFAAMDGDERARRCERCGIVVHDLSAVSEDEAAALVASPEVRCVRFAVDRRGDIRFRVAAASAVAALLAASTVAIAAAPPIEPETEKQKPSPPSASDASSDVYRHPDVDFFMGRK